jgi:hypothetical protein
MKEAVEFSFVRMVGGVVYIDSLWQQKIQVWNRRDKQESKKSPSRKKIPATM